MAASYIPQGSHRDIQVVSPTQVIDVQVDTGLTVPSSIYFQVPIPLEAWKAGSGPEYMATTATGLEELAAGLDVVNVYTTQDLDANGLVADFAVATVQIPTPKGKIGPFQTDVYVPIGLLGTDPAIYNQTVVPMLEKAVAELEATAGA